MDWIGFRRFVKEYLKTNDIKEHIYICSADTAICLRGLFENRRFSFQINELYDTNKFYKNAIKRTVGKASAIIVPEFSRANLFAYWYSLDKLPYVIPNMPYAYSDSRNQYIHDDTARSVIDSISGKKIILYQGNIINKVRNLIPLAKALSIINDENLALVLMGHNRNGSVEDIQKEYPLTYYIPFIAAPDHLQITSHADIGIVNYNRSSLNNMFCAPNKVFEYGCYSIPILGNDIPGLKYCIETHRFGECADFNDIKAIVNALGIIRCDYDQYSANARQYYEHNEYYDNLNKLFIELKELCKG